MAGVRTSLTEAQIESRRNHYLEKIGQGKPKAKGTKSNPLKNEDLARMLKARFGKKGKAKNAGKATGEAIAELNQQTAGTENAASKSKAATEPKTWKKYLNERGKEYTAPKSGVAEADRRAAEIIKKNEEAAKALRQEALYNAERINKPFSTSAQQIDKQLGLGHKYTVSPNYAEEYAKLMDEKYGKVTEAPKEVKGAADGKKKAVKTPSSLTHSEAHQLQNMVSDESLENLKKAKANLEAEEAAAKKTGAASSETPAQKKQTTEPKTWKKYLNERGKEYTAPKSGVAEADKRAAEIIKKNEEAANVNRQKALSNAKKINKPFVITADEIDKNLGIGEKKYPVSGSYADDYAKLLDEKYGPQGGSKPATSGKIPQAGASAAEAAEKGKAGAKNAVKDGAKKPGFFSKIGNFFKGKTGKFALAAAAVAVVAGLIKCCSGDDKKDNNLVMPTPSVPDKPEVTPQESKYDVCYEEGEMPKSYTIKAGDYPSAIISAMYGVKFGTPEYNAIKEAVYNASEYQPNTNLYAGDKFTLPDVEVNGKVYSANPEAEVTPGTIADNGLKLAHTKEVVKEDDKFYIIYKETGEKVPNEPSFDSEDAARGRILELDEAEKEQK